jgi:hypothetical protein
LLSSCCAVFGAQSSAGSNPTGDPGSDADEEDGGRHRGCALQESELNAGCEGQDLLSPLPHFASRSMGSLTAWQMLAADVQQEMEEAAASEQRASHARSSQHVRPSMVMSDDAVPRGNEAPGVFKDEADLLAEYQLLSEIGRGAFGAAWKARRRADQSLVCIKVLDTQRMGHAERQMVMGCVGAGRLCVWFACPHCSVEQHALCPSH